MKRLGGGKDFPKDTTPYVAYYRFKKSPKPHALEKVLVPGQEIDAMYLHTFLESGKEGTESEGLTFKKHLLMTKEGKISIAGCGSINKALDGLKRNTPVHILFVGKGKAKKGQKAPYLFEVWDMSDEAQKAVPAVQDIDVPDDEDQAEVEF